MIVRVDTLGDVAGDRQHLELLVDAVLAELLGRRVEPAELRAGQGADAGEAGAPLTFSSVAKWVIDLDHLLAGFEHQHELAPPADVLEDPIAHRLRSGRGADVGAGLAGVVERVGLGGVLLGLDHQPSAVAGLGQGGEDRGEVDGTVAGTVKAASTDSRN